MGATSLKAVTNCFPPAGENQTSEAPGVVFDPTIGEEGVETPLPNDSSKASLSPPVGGHLCSFRRDWQTMPQCMYCHSSQSQSWSDFL